MKKGIEILKVLAILLPTIFAVLAYWDTPTGSISVSLWNAGLSVVSLLVLYLVVYSSYEIINENWSKCRKFAQTSSKSVCKMVEYCLKAEKEYAKSAIESFLYFYKERADTYTKFLKDIVYCFEHCAKSNAKMTLPCNPYTQKDSDNTWTNLSNITAPVSKSKVKTREKIISLQTGEKNNFAIDFFTDIGNTILSGQKKTKFDEYLELHKQRKIKLHWYNNTTDTATKEFIVIDDSAVILYDKEEKTIKIDFNGITLSDCKSDFDTLLGQNPKTTKEFINANIIPMIDWKIYSCEQKILVENYLRQIER